MKGGSREQGTQGGLPGGGGGGSGFRKAECSRVLFSRHGAEARLMAVNKMAQLSLS